MCSMCHHCGAQINSSNVDRKSVEHVNSIKLSKQDSTLSCKCYKVMDGRENIPGDGRHSSCATPTISPTASFSSNDRSMSSSSKCFSVYRCLVALFIEWI